MTTNAETAVTTQVYRVYIKASPEAVWDALTKLTGERRTMIDRAGSQHQRGGPVPGEAGGQREQE
jgi:uncharacterized protein YndB with AHSA1/START domain